jgi:glycosyltransferase involved in cell wall biosynthesis
LTRVMHVITGLDIGGAELMLLKLLSASGGDLQSMVVSLKDEGMIGPSIAKLGVPVECLELRPYLPNPARLLSLRSLARRFRPHVIQGWMPHGNLAASLTQFASRISAPVIWNIRMSLDGVDGEQLTTMGLIRLGAYFSRHPSAIIYNSRSGARQHEQRGYRSGTSVVISNGFDCNIFQPDEPARSRIREQLGLEPTSLLVGLVARFHPMKDQSGFLHAASLVSAQHPESRFLLVGKGLTGSESALTKLIKELGLMDRVLLLGERTDVPRLTAALDIACSSSAWGEGFSNSVGEAMACGVPCIVTDVGDSGFLVGDTGIIVPPRNPEALAYAIEQLIAAGSARRRELGLAARRRIESEFSLPKITRRYEDLYNECLMCPQYHKTNGHIDVRGAA